MIFLLYITFWPLFGALLWALGVYWCFEVIKRFRSDVEELREVEEVSRKIGIIIVWAITAGIAFLVIGSAVAVVRRIALGIRYLL